MGGVSGVGSFQQSDATFKKNKTNQNKSTVTVVTMFCVWILLIILGWPCLPFRTCCIRGIKHFGTCFNGKILDFGLARVTLFITYYLYTYALLELSKTTTNGISEVLTENRQNGGKEGFQDNVCIIKSP